MKKQNIKERNEFHGLVFVGSELQKGSIERKVNEIIGCEGRWRIAGRVDFQHYLSLCIIFVKKKLQKNEITFIFIMLKLVPGIEPKISTD